MIQKGPFSHGGEPCSQAKPAKALRLTRDIREPVESEAANHRLWLGCNELWHQFLKFLPYRTNESVTLAQNVNTIKQLTQKEILWPILAQSNSRGNSCAHRRDFL